MLLKSIVLFVAILSSLWVTGYLLAFAVSGLNKQNAALPTWALAIPSFFWAAFYLLNGLG